VFDDGANYDWLMFIDPRFLLVDRTRSPLRSVTVSVLEQLAELTSDEPASFYMSSFLTFVDEPEKQHPCGSFQDMLDKIRRHECDDRLILSRDFPQTRQIGYQCFCGTSWSLPLMFARELSNTDPKLADQIRCKVGRIRVAADLTFKDEE
jgi:hypothetical protein